MWTTEQTLKLIEELKWLPGLWENVGYFKSKTKRHDALQELADKFNVKGREIVKRLYGLKSQFRREHKKISNPKINGKKCIWFGYEPLLYLKHGTGTSKRKCREEMDEVKVEIVENAINESTNEAEGKIEIVRHDNDWDSPLLRPALKRKPFIEHQNKDGITTDSLKSLSEVLNQRDEYSIYGEHIAAKLRAQKSRKEVSTAQYQIDHILFNLEMGRYAEEKDWTVYQCP
ncbi:uncharacterized protein [Rhodnius prolixus]|uniref:MADF domain-containing protein n=1 Tax=Rhodnius prolixus TaxID=13249 RepID=T1I3G4_RHOPR